ncbi:MAG: ATP-binding protein [Actinomycetota bacterium]|nr:ATP-binding protein [Actinomycetota bacterium]
MRFGLRTRVAIAFGVISLVIAAAVSSATYFFASYYLLNQREDSALTRALLDSRAVGASLSAGLSPNQSLEQIPTIGSSQALVRVAGTWYTSGVTVPPDALPVGLLETAASAGGAQQRAAIGGDPYFVVAVQLTDAMYVEVFSLADLDRTLTIGAWLLSGQTLVAGAVGVVIGRYTVGQVLRPVLRLGAGTRRIASGDLATRIDETGDRDLDPIASSFNEMAEAVQSRIQRERRFSANVSHELRSPLTTVVGTADLLDRRRDQLPEREAGLIAVLVEQVHRMSQMLLDLLEISRIGGDDPIQVETVDVSLLCLDVVRVRNLPDELVAGDSPVIRTDGRRFERIVGNLVENAQRHGGGVETIRVERRSDTVRIYVEDRGPGIDPAQLEKLFEPFTRGEDAHHTSGAGLGLAIAREQANLLNADLLVENRESGGTRFIVEIPISRDSPDSLDDDRNGS